jgi:hypothetical protein
MPNLISELTLDGIFDLKGVGKAGNLIEFGSGGGFTLGNVLEKRLIQTDQRVDFVFEWTVKGMFAHAFNPNFRWRIEVFMERYGPLDFDLGANGIATLNYGSGDLVAPDEVSYPGAGAPTSTTVSIPPNTIPEGVYDVVAVLRLLHPAGDDTPCFLAAFAEFGKINFYQEH